MASQKLLEKKIKKIEKLLPKSIINELLAKLKDLDISEDKLDKII